MAYLGKVSTKQGSVKIDRAERDRRAIMNRRKGDPGAPVGTTQRVDVKTGSQTVPTQAVPAPTTASLPLQPSIQGQLPGMKPPTGEVFQGQLDPNSPLGQQVLQGSDVPSGMDEFRANNPGLVDAAGKFNELMWGDPNSDVKGGPVWPIGPASAANAVKVGTAVDDALAVGKKAVDAGKATSSAEAIATNTKTVKDTTQWLSKLGNTLKDPRTVVGTLVASIGSYPFAGFIKEEALQTLGFATKTAIENGDFQGAQEALAMQEDILNPNLWSKIIAALPYLNVVDSLKDFYASAKLKVEIDRRLLNDLQQKGDLSDEEFLNKVDDDFVADSKASADYWAQVQKDLAKWKEEAEDRDMKEDAEFWEKERKKKLAEQKAQEEMNARIWLEYRKAYYDYTQSRYENSRPSNLNFGLL